MEFKDTRALLLSGPTFAFSGALERRELDAAQPRLTAGSLPSACRTPSLHLVLLVGRWEGGCTLHALFSPN